MLCFNETIVINIEAFNFLNFIEGPPDLDQIIPGLDTTQQNQLLRDSGDLDAGGACCYRETQSCFLIEPQ